MTDELQLGQLPLTFFEKAEKLGVLKINTGTLIEMKKKLKITATSK